LSVYTVNRERIPELAGEGRLGRHIHQDSRQAAYAHRRSGAAPVSTTWVRHIPILDQGSLGSCTGNAMAGACGCSPLFEALPAAHPPLDEQEAVLLYSRAEIIDGGPGYPPEDQGSSGQSVCTAAKNSGLISGYTWALNVTDAVDALQSGPVMFGVNWYSSFDTPDPSGLVALSATAYVRGGHEFVCREVDVANEVFWDDNSWGPSFGLAGRFGVPFAVMDRLFAEQGDCVIPHPLSAPAPTPQPAPTPTPTPPGPVPTPTPTPDIHVDSADQALAAALPHGWAAEHHVGENGHAAKAIRAWLHAKGLS
jgi:hypothetical protein